ncbi:MAG: hypothetical protein IT534_13390 [Bauldia sp.]|nr:hypothetical protein [Bauldia sp.]
MLRPLALAIGIAGLAQGAAAQGAINPCVDFSLFSSGTRLPDSFQLGGMTFTAVTPAGQLRIVGSGGEVGLQFARDGIDVGFPSAVADVALRIGTFAGPVTVSGIDPLGNLVSPLVVPATNTFEDVTYVTHGPIVGVRIEGGGNEGNLRKICALSRTALLTLDYPDVPIPPAMTTAAANVGTADTVWVFRFDGTIQCSDAPEVTLGEDRAFLERLGPDVIAAEKRSSIVPAVCGAPTGRANVFEISAQDWVELERSIVGPMGFALWPFDDRRTVEVYKYDGTLQCGMGHEIPLDVMEAELRAARIEVLSSRKGNDGLMHIAVCGASTGDVNIYTIRSVSLPIALDLGFLLLGDRGDRFMPMAGGLPLPWPFPW